MEDSKIGLPEYVNAGRVGSRDTSLHPRRGRLSRGLRVVLCVVLSLATLQYLGLSTYVRQTEEAAPLPLRAQEWLEKCQALSVPPGPPPDFYARKASDRFVPGTTPTLITASCLFSVSLVTTSTHSTIRMLPSGLVAPTAWRK